ncbi:unnamed protein product [Ilex paraguariensis]|uniref:FYVE-type domain-containing protein n=1 Tax=Ilex paraguariensis TaxID=185542 RepID=A0ABC8UDJ2_9AQUA
MQPLPADYISNPYYQYPQNPNPNPTDNHPLPLPSYASAPPFTANYPPSSSPDYSSFTSTYPPYPQNPDPVPTAPSYSQNSNLQQTLFTPPPPPPPPPQSQPPSFPQFESHGPPYQPPAHQQPPPYYPPYDQHHTAVTAPNYTSPSTIAPNLTTNPNSGSPYSSLYSSQYNQLVSSVPPAYENQYENNLKFDQSGGFSDDLLAQYGNYDRSRSDLGSGLYGERYESGERYDSGGYGNDEYGDGVYAYQGSKVEPYGARGTAPKSSTWSGFDDFGRPIGFSSGKDPPTGSTTKIVRAVPKTDAQQDVKSGIQKFRVKLLPDGGNHSTMDVLCQIGLDGIRMLDPSTSRILRIYPLDTISRCEVTDSSTFTCWSKSSVDVEPRRIRLQSNSYTTNTILDTVTAATVQFKEMGGRNRPPESSKMVEQPNEKKKGLGDLMNLMKPANEEKDHWVPDEAVSKCTGCGTDFNAFVRKHHCRNCGDIFCDKCTHGRIALTTDENAPQVRVCDQCMAEVTQRLSNAKEAASRLAGLQSHEDLAKKLQEEMERNRKASSGSKSEGSGRQMKEVACPTCTVHLQVQVPNFGSETIECGVCQNPFLVSAH